MVSELACDLRVLLIIAIGELNIMDAAHPKDDFECLTVTQ